MHILMQNRQLFIAKKLLLNRKGLIMKKTLPLLLSIFLLLSTQSVFAESTTPTNIEYLPDGSYYVTVIEDSLPSEIQLFSSKTVTKTKTTYLFLR